MSKMQKNPCDITVDTCGHNGYQGDFLKQWKTLLTMAETLKPMEDTCIPTDIWLATHGNPMEETCIMTDLWLVYHGRNLYPMADLLSNLG